jgi:hypothetical protein
MTDHQCFVLCQSCGTAMHRYDDFGTDTNGCKVDDYCQSCFQDGAFVEPHLSLDDMIARIVGGMRMHSDNEPSVRRAVRGLLGVLSRWNAGGWTALPSGIPEPLCEERSR